MMPVLKAGFFWYGLLFYFGFCSSQSIDYDSNFPLISNGSVIELRLTNYNVSDLDGQSVEDFYAIAPQTVVEVRVTALPKDAAFVVVQAHSHLRPVRLAYDAAATTLTSVWGTNVGLLKPAATTVSFYLSYGNLLENATVMVAVQAYGARAPVPGGCNMEFPVEDSPYLNLTYTTALVSLSFAAAGRSMALPSCDVKPPATELVVYRLYLPERDHGPSAYFATVQSLLTRGRIARAGAATLGPRLGLPTLRRLVAAYPGTGVAYVVVANTLTDSAVYVPAVTYSCDASGGETSCPSIPDTLSKVVWALVFFLGLLLCFAGHQFFNYQLFVWGALSGFLISYMALSAVYGETDLFVPALISGAAGIATVLSYACLGFPIMAVAIASLFLGFSFAAILFYGIVDQVQLLESDVNYWALFGCVLILLPMLLASLAERANMLACSVIGAFALITPVDLYIGANLRFIPVNVFRRATVDQFNFAAIDPPFQVKDAALASCWFALSVLGYCAQLLLNRGKPPFPAPGRPLRRVREALVVLRVQQSVHRGEHSETSALIPPGQPPARTYLG